MIDIKPKSGFQRLFSEFENWTAATLIGVSNHRMRFTPGLIFEGETCFPLSVPLIDNCVPR